MRRTLVAVFLALAVPSAWADVLTLEVKSASAPGQERYMGAGAGTVAPTAAAKSATFGTIGYDNDSLLKNGKPWLPVMGEFHYSRYPANEWREELLKMKAGGITIISTYVFWIHHEEVKGQFDWTGGKDLHAFVKLCGELGLPILIRIGPWCHGEVRNGGHPDWIDALPRKRRNAPDYMAAVKPLYTEIAAQLKGLLWKDGGPIVGIQLENETNDGPYLVALKNMARTNGLEVPLYTKTGWPALKNPVPFGELLPFFGSYAEGFWDRSLESMPQDKYWQAFAFSPERIDTAIGSDIFGLQPRPDESDVISYPYLTCEIGTGMVSSYHRRISMSTMDTYALALIKIGSGTNLPGYYLYHGATNPESKTGKVMSESQSTGMWNDLPNKSYDWDGPLGEFGQVRESYHYLRRLHLFLNDYGDRLARMASSFPSNVKEKTDNKTVRWSVRSDGTSGFLFVSNYQRGLGEPSKSGTQFNIKLPKGGEIRFPAVTLPANAGFFWPMNMDIGGAKVIYATAQPICNIVDNGTTYSVFCRTPGVGPEFVFERGSVIFDTDADKIVHGEATDKIQNFSADSKLVPIQMHTAEGRKQAIILLDDPMSLQISKGMQGGKEHLFISASGQPIFDEDGLRMSVQSHFHLLAFPPLVPDYIITPNLPQNNASEQGLFAGISTDIPLPAIAPVVFEQVQQAGPSRNIKMGSQKVAEQPTDVDFAGAQPAVYRIHLPAGLANMKNTRVLLRMHYTGDVARLYSDDKLIEDNFYNGHAMDMGTWRLPANTAELTLKILPLQKKAPIMLPVWPDMKGKETVATLDKVELIPEQTVTLEKQ